MAELEKEEVSMSEADDEYAVDSVYMTQTSMMSMDSGKYSVEGSLVFKSDNSSKRDSDEIKKENGGVINNAFESSTDDICVDVEAPSVSKEPHSHSAPDLQKPRKRQLQQDYVTDDGEEVSLVYARHEKIPMKDFAAEIRASMDVENFLNSAVLLLDVTETNMEEILALMLKQLITQDEPHVTIDEAKKAIFTAENVPALAKTIQGTFHPETGGVDFDQQWLTVMCTMPMVQRRHVAIARLKNPANLGRHSQEVYFIILVVAPTKEKGTKNALETGRTFATLFADVDLRLRLLAVRNEEDFKKYMWEHTKQLAEEQSQNRKNKKNPNSNGDDPEEKKPKKQLCRFGVDLVDDLKRRLPYYVSDFKDGIFGHKTIHKTAATTVFLYFACILPSIAFGMLNDNNTHGKIDVKKVIYSQTIGGLIFALIGGQPLTILLTTAPLALYTKVVYNICEDWDLEFYSMYAMVGLWNMFFLIIYALFGLSRLMRWSTRSTEEIFALFISIAFLVDAMRDVSKSFQDNYYTPACDIKTSSLSGLSTVSSNTTTEALTTMAATTVSPLLGVGNNTTVETVTDHVDVVTDCLRENSLLFLLLMLGTLWLGIYLYNFTKTPFLNANKREILADYALPVSVIVMSFFGSYVFRQVKLQPFNYYADSPVFTPAPLHKLSWGGILGACGLGFSLSLLFFMDQNISSAMVNSPSNKLKKGDAYNWDLLVVGVLNGFLAFMGMPMMHGALPHSPLHVRALADVEDFVEQGHVYQKVVHARETRVTAILSHILIGLSIFMFPYPISYIPRPVLDGLFLYLSISALDSFQFFDRILLFFTEQAAYPPTHYIRSVPQRKVHMFTLTQLVQLGVMCGFGFAPMPYLKMCFPVLILLLLPIRHKLVPLLIEKKYLDALDGSHI